METWLQLDLGEGVLEEALYPSPFPWGCQGQGPLEKQPGRRLRSRSPHTSLHTRTTSSSVGGSVGSSSLSPQHSSKTLQQAPTASSSCTHTHTYANGWYRTSQAQPAAAYETSSHQKHSSLGNDTPTFPPHTCTVLGTPAPMHTHFTTGYSQPVVNTHSYCTTHIQGSRQSSPRVSNSKLQTISDFQGCRLGLTGSRGRKACQVDEPGPLEPDSLLSAASCSGWCLPASASRPSSFLLPAGLEGQLDFIKRAWGGDSVGRVYAGPHAVPPSSHSKHASS